MWGRQKLYDREELMYKMMSAIYNSGIPMEFKGSMVLRAFLSGKDFDAMRHTKDFDANWLSDKAPTGAQLTKSIQKAVDRLGLGIEVRQYREFGEGKSAGFEFWVSGQSQPSATLDMDVNRPTYMSCTYEVGDFKFRGVVVEQMLADKICAVSGDKIFRRSKDILDLYYLSKVCELNYAKICEAMTAMKKAPDSFEGFLSRKEELRHAYDKFKVDTDVEKPDFDTVYNEVFRYIEPFMNAEPMR